MKGGIHATPAPLLARLMAMLMAVLMVVTPVAAQGSDAATKQTKSSATTKHTTKAKAKSRKPTSSAKKKRVKTTKKTRHHPRHRRPSAKTRRIRMAFVASTELRPMAQQLATLRTPAAYAGVTSYATKHTGDAAAAAYLALGHAYMLDKRYANAVTSFSNANKASDVLADYTDFLAAQAEHASGDEQAAEALLHGFTKRYPDSIFVAQAPELEANVLLAMKNPEAARKVLTEAANGPAAHRSGYELAQAQVAQALGQKDESVRLFKLVLMTHPLSGDAETARTQLTALGAESTLTVAELRSLGDAYYRAHRYRDASDEYHALARQAGLSQASRNGFAVAAAACDLKLKRLSKAQAEALPDTPDDNGARRMYLLMELARDRGDESGQQAIVMQMETRFPQSQWLAEALFSSGNMYLLSRDYPRAVEYYGELAKRFPKSRYAPAAHWRAGWLSYRQRLYADAARLFDEQIELYPAASETVAALYWRARIYETQDHKPALAAANYRAIIRAYQHYFYAQMARARLAAMGDVRPAKQARLDQFKAGPAPALDDDYPDDNEHLAKARVLANAGLNDYVPLEIAADPDSASWSSLAEAEIFTSYGETFRAMRALKRALPRAATASIQSIPLVYWRILFPEPYWDTIKAESAKNHLDPYLVASLIRQESEFNPSVISYANAYGLMQLLPSVGRAMAREEGIKHFQTFQLLNPETNIRLGTRYLRKMLDHFDGVEEYALAAYNAGDSRVEAWEAAGPYDGMDEFVESIPFTQTREYVQAILRNIETYREIDAAERASATARSSGSESGGQ